MPISDYWKQRIIQYYFTENLLYGKIAKILEKERLTVLKKTIWAIIKKYEEHGTIHHLPGSGRPSLLSQELHKPVEDHMRSNDETTSNQIVQTLIAATRMWCL